MKRNVCMSSTLRQPVRSFLLLILIGLLSFAFIVSAVEFIAVRLETERLGSYYRAVGSITFDDSEASDYESAIDVISKSQYIDFINSRRYCSGVLQGMKNSDINGQTSDRYNGQNNMGLHVSDFIVYAKLLSIETNRTFNSLGDNGCYILTMQIDDVVAGYPEMVTDNMEITLLFPLDDYVQGDSPVDEMEVGNRYFIRGRKVVTYKHMMISLSDGSVWVGTSPVKDAGTPFIMQQLTDNGPWYLNVVEGASLEFNTPDMNGISGEIELLLENQSAMQVISIKDMSAMPNLQEASHLYYLTEGRWLNREDDLYSRKVCVIHHVFGMTRGLKLGDKITMKIRSLENPFIGYIVDGPDKGNWQDYATYEEEFEIVGMYGLALGDTSVQPLSRSLFIYIPDACLPEEYGLDSADSFALKSTEYQDAFVTETRKALAELGASVIFVENNSRDFWAIVHPMQRSSEMSMVIFATVLVLTQTLVVFLYLQQRRKEIAISRALGLKRRFAMMHSILPLSLIGLVGTVAGGAAAWNFALKRAANTLGALSGLDGTTVSSSLPLIWLVLFCAAALLALVVQVTAGTLIYLRSPVFGMLASISAGSVMKQARKAVATDESVASQYYEQQANARQEGKPTFGIMYNGAYVVMRRKRTITFTKRDINGSSQFTFRHILRSPFKSILMAVAALVLLLALTWISWLIEDNKERMVNLYDTIEISGEIVRLNPSVGVGQYGIIKSSTADAVIDSGFMSGIYLEASVRLNYICKYISGGTREQQNPDGSSIMIKYDAVFDSDKRYKNVEFIGISDTETFLKTTGCNISVEYWSGWDEHLYTTEWTASDIMELSKLTMTPEELRIFEGQYYLIMFPCVPTILSKEAMALMELELGDYYYIRDSRLGDAGPYSIVVGMYDGSLSSMDFQSPPILTSLSALRAYEEVLEHPPTLAAYSIVRFTLESAKNREMDEFRKLMATVLDSDSAGLLPLRLLLWDEELRTAIAPMERNIQLLTILFPVIITVSVIIAFVISMLLMTQNAKRAAVMRVLGDTKQRVQLLLCTEQFVLCVIGVVLSLVALAAIRRDIQTVFDESALLCVGLYLAGSILGSVVSAMIVTKRKPLEMLQVKE